MASVAATEVKKKMFDGVPATKPAIFIMLLRNLNEVPGFRLNKPQYSPYPHENQLILMESSKIRVLEVEEDAIEIQGRQISIIYLINL